MADERLNGFVHEALVGGRSRAEIRSVLDEADWSAPEIDEALAAYTEHDFTPPVPRPRPYVSAREAFVYAVMFVALGMVAWHLVSVGWNLIEEWRPEPDDRWNDNADSIRFSVASLIVFVPLFGGLYRYTVARRRDDPGRRRSAVRKWFGYLTLFIASMFLIGDLVAVIYSFLDGELSIRVATKALVLAAVAGGVLAWFRSEIVDDAGGARRVSARPGGSR